MDSVQLVLLVVIVALTSLLIVLGVQVFLILRDLRKTIVKTNRVLDTADSIAENISGPLSTISTLALGVKASSLVAIAKMIKGLLGHDKNREEEKKRNRE